MSSLFIFTEHLNERGCVCVMRSDNGSIEKPASFFSFDEIRSFIAQSKVIVVDSALHASIHEIELPLMNEKKARIAVPFAAEDLVAESIHELHFAFHPKFYYEGKYLVAVIRKAHLHQLIERLQAEDIPCQHLCLDWFALNPEEHCSTQQALLVNKKDFKGALDKDLAELYLQQFPETSVLTFKDSISLKKPVKSIPDDHSVCDWLSQRLATKAWINLSQAEFLVNNEQYWLKNAFFITVFLAALWLLTIITTDGYKIHYLNKETAVVDEQIARIYKQFFPDAKKVVNPKFRIQQLSASGNQNRSNKIWFLLNQLSKTINNNTSTVSKLVFQNKQILITIISPDFAALERFENELKQSSIQVNQTQAKSQDDKVIATLELS